MLRVAVAVWPAMLAVGCGDAFGPQDLAGTYTLRALDDQAVPLSLGGTAGSGFRSLDADTLTLGADGTFVDVQYFSQSGGTGMYGSSTPPPAFTHEAIGAGGTWTVRGTTIALTPAAGASTYAAGTASGAVQTARSFEVRYTDAYAAAHRRTYTRP